jgi:tetratricopeptide (TPR) repeat protein
MFLGMTVLRQGDHGGARPLLQESVAHFREVGDRWGLAHALNVLRQAVVAGDDFEAAQVYQRESVDLWRALGDTWGLALALNGLAEIARIQGNPELAVPLYEESLSLFRGASDTGNTAIVLHNLAHAVLDLGDKQEARRLFAQALQIDYERGGIKGVLECLAGLGAVAAAEAQWLEAAHILGYVHERFKVTGLAMCPVDQTVYTRAVALVCTHTDPREQATAWDQGGQMSLERAVAFATAGKVNSD